MDLLTHDANHTDDGNEAEGVVSNELAMAVERVTWTSEDIDALQNAYGRIMAHKDSVIAARDATIAAQEETIRADGAAMQAAIDNIAHLHDGRARLKLEARLSARQEGK